MYKIGELSRLCRIPVKTLRFYDKEGLLVPDEIDSFTGYRYYSAKRIADCNRIISLKELGFSLEEIKKHLQASTDDDIIALVDAKCTELTEKATELSLQLKKLGYLKKSLLEGKNAGFSMAIRRGDTIAAAFQRKIYASKADAEKTLEQMKATLPKQLIGERVMIVNFEIEYPDKNLDLAVCVEITGKLTGNLGYEEREFVFSGEIATLACKREQLDDGYYAILSQIYEIDYQITGAAYEIYYGDGTVELKIPVCRKENCIDEQVERVAFENDETAVGRWEIRDIVTCKEQFVYGYPKCPEVEESVWHELYFPEGGEPYWFLKGWTKGYLYLEVTVPEPHLVANPYTIESMNGHTMMFLEIPRRYEDGSKDVIPRLLVFEKVSEQSILAKDIQIHYT